MTYEYSRAIECGNIQEFVRICINNIKKNNLNSLYIDACEKGQLKFLKKFSEWKCDIEDETYTTCFHISSVRGYTKIMEYLYENYYIKINMNDINNFIDACSCGKLESIKRLYKWYNEKQINLEIHDKNECAFRYACKNGHLNIVKQLKEWTDDNHDPINISANRNESFYNACSNGHLNIIKFLNEWKPELKLYEIKEAFVIACEKGHLNIVEQLYRWSIEDENPLKIEEDEFIFACKKGYINIIRKLYEWSNGVIISREGTKLSIITDEAFRTGCMYSWITSATSYKLSQEYGYDSLYGKTDEELIQFKAKLLNNHNKTIQQLLLWSTPERIQEFLKIMENEYVNISKMMRPVLARIQIKYWLIWCLYNPNTHWGKRYTTRLITEDNPLISNIESET